MIVFCPAANIKTCFPRPVIRPITCQESSRSRYRPEEAGYNADCRDRGQCRLHGCAVANDNEIVLSFIPPFPFLGFKGALFDCV